MNFDINKLRLVSALFFLVSTSVACNVLALGNYPEAGSCPKQKPYYAICTHSFHSLEGWFSDQCHADKEAALHDAEVHAKRHHQGKMRWTGISQPR